MIINQANLSDFFRGIKRVFDRSLATDVPARWNQVATMVRSSSKYEDYGWLGEAEDLREWLGPKHVTRLKAFKYTLANLNYERTVAVDRHDLADDNVGVYASRAEGLAAAARVWADKLVFDNLVAGITNNCYDGQPFFDTQHPVGKSTTTLVSNTNTGGGGSGYWYLLDTTRPLKPLILQMRQEPTFVNMTRMDNERNFMMRELMFGVEARANAGYGLWQTAYSSNQALSSATFRAARLAMNNFENDEGRELGINPNLLVVGRANQDTARDLFGQERLATGETNMDRNAVQVLVVPWLP